MAGGIWFEGDYDGEGRLETLYARISGMGREGDGVDAASVANLSETLDLVMPMRPAVVLQGFGDEDGVRLRFEADDDGRESIVVDTLSGGRVDVEGDFLRVAIGAFAGVGDQADEIVGDVYRVARDIEFRSPVGVVGSADCLFEASSPSGAEVGYDATFEVRGLDMLDVGGVTSMRGLFRYCSALTSADLSGWDTSNVTTFEDMFRGCADLEEVRGLGGLDTRRLRSIGGMFSGCSSLREIRGMDRFDMRSIEELGWAFEGCSELRRVDLPVVGRSRLTSGASMYVFEGCDRLEEVGNMDAFLASFDGDASVEASLAGCPAMRELRLHDAASLGAWAGGRLERLSVAGADLGGWTSEPSRYEAGGDLERLPCMADRIEMDGIVFVSDVSAPGVTAAYGQSLCDGDECGIGREAVVVGESRVVHGTMFAALRESGNLGGVREDDLRAPLEVFRVGDDGAFGRRMTVGGFAERFWACEPGGYGTGRHRGFGTPVSPWYEDSLEADPTLREAVLGSMRSMSRDLAAEAGLGKPAPEDAAVRETSDLVGGRELS